VNDLLSEIEDTVARALQNLSHVDGPTIRSTVVKLSETLCPIYGQSSLNEADIDLIAKKLEERFDITMSLGTLFSAAEYRPWLDEQRVNVAWFYWGRYKRFLAHERFPPNVLNSLDNITDQILDHLENPAKEGHWSRKGMVVGHVQSGKTANYIGLISKSADSGYRVIIVLAGMLNALRNQTQERLDSGFIGRATDTKQKTGVGVLAGTRMPAYFTTVTGDFNKAVANQIGVEIGHLKEPVLLVIKKNKNTLNNLVEWLKYNNPHNLKDHPMLLIDDEADYASINTRKEDEDVTAINQGIRQLLKLFDRSSYVGYTATPFANVFIDPDSETEMLGDDLFPRDFIISLDPPTNYVGPSSIFPDDAKSDTVVEIEDYQDVLPTNHKKDWNPGRLPESLKDAVRTFVLVKAIRSLRGQGNRHNSMMVNVTRFTSVQTSLRLLLDQYLKEELIPGIVNYYALNEEEATKNRELAMLRDRWRTAYPQSGYSWKQVQSKLKEAITSIGVIEVNSASSAAKLDYSSRNYPNGRSVIAIGGLSLSRGLTLEGLSVSYFLRNSIMYDTLMQMGRWFGYRDGYSDLCRIYMTHEAASWYAYISVAMEELRDEFKRMKLAGMTPNEFGLCVRTHPDSLIVTARNKMRTGTKVARKVNLEGRLVETTVLINNPEAIRANRDAVERLIDSAKVSGVPEDTKFGFLWKGLDPAYILGFVEAFRNHPACQLTEPIPLKEYIQWIAGHGMKSWDVVLVGLKKKESSSLVYHLSGLEIIAQKRTVSLGPDSSIVFPNSKVHSRGLESAGLTEDQVRDAVVGYEKNIPDHTYRKVPGRSPLLMVHLVDCVDKLGMRLFASPVAAYGISFPGNPGTHAPTKLVDYGDDMVEENGDE
jgi:hypothetical protein